MSKHKIKQIIMTELEKIQNRKLIGSNMVILCPYHSDTNPSFNVNIDETNRRVPLGYGFCFSCGAKKPWNEIAKSLNLKTISKKQEAQSSAYPIKTSDTVKSKLLSDKNNMTFEKLCENLGVSFSVDLEDSDRWRGFSARLLKKAGAKIAVDEYDNKCLILPVYIDGNLEGGIKALWEKPKSKKISSYYNMPGEWSKTHGLFLFDAIKKLAKEKGYVVLVEGPRDALRLFKYKVPAVSIIGTKTWGKEKINLLLTLNVEKIVVMMDGDSAGASASNTIMKSIKGKIERQRIRMSDYSDKLGFDADPCNLPRKYLKRVIKEIE